MLGRGRSRAPDPVPCAGENMPSQPAANALLGGRHWKKARGLLDHPVHISNEVSPGAGALALSVLPLVCHLSVRTCSVKLGSVLQKALEITAVGHGTDPTA